VAEVVCTLGRLPTRTILTRRSIDYRHHLSGRRLTHG